MHASGACRFGLTDLQLLSASTIHPVKKPQLSIVGHRYLGTI